MARTKGNQSLGMPLPLPIIYLLLPLPFLFPSPNTVIAPFEASPNVILIMHRHVVMSQYLLRCSHEDAWRGRGRWSGEGSRLPPKRAAKSVGTHFRLTRGRHVFHSLRLARLCYLNAFSSSYFLLSFQDSPRSTNRRPGRLRRCLYHVHSLFSPCGLRSQRHCISCRICHAFRPVFSPYQNHKMNCVRAS